MGGSRRCQECGSQLPESGPSAGLCPRCLLGQGLASGSPTRTGGAGTGRFEPPDPAELGRQFPQLEILELLGQGGMGAVYKARQPALDRMVALKILAPDRVRDPAFAERFGREARTLARLSHPHIVGVHDVGQADSLYYIVMEYVDGASLREVMQAAKLSPGDALALVPQLCDALQFAHDAGVVHRDIKPENILLDRSGKVKIADFGLAKLLEPDRADGVSLTASGAVMGTPAYMAPEQIEHPLDVDHRADIYALGVVFYEMLTGELPLGRFDPPSSKVRVDVRLDQVVLRALEKEPIRRYQLAGDVKVDLEQLDGTAAEPGPDPDAPGTRAITRPPAVTWIAAYSFLMAAFWPALAGLTSLGFVLGAEGLGAGAGSLPQPLALVALTVGAPLCLALSVWHVISGVGALRLRSWARYSLIILAIVESPGVLLVSLTWLFIVLLPVTLVSALILIYLSRRAVARAFRALESTKETTVKGNTLILACLATLALAFLASDAPAGEARSDAPPVNPRVLLDLLDDKDPDCERIAGLLLGTEDGESFDSRRIAEFLLGIADEDKIGSEQIARMLGVEDGEAIDCDRILRLVLGLDDDELDGELIVRFLLGIEDGDAIDREQIVRMLQETGNAAAHQRSQE